MLLANLNDEYILIFPAIRAVSVYDSIQYDFYDLEVLAPAQRIYLVNKVKEIGYKQTSGKWLSHIDGTQIFFPPHKLFNRNFKSFLPKKQPENVWLAVTPTQAAYLLLTLPSVDEEDLYQLMMKHPFNLKRLQIALEHEPCYSHFEKLQPELQRLFDRAQILLKNKLPLGHP